MIRYTIGFGSLLRDQGMTDGGMTDGAGIHRDAAGADVRSLLDRVRADGGMALWLLFNAVVAVLALVEPLRPVTRAYMAAAIDWWTAEPLVTDGVLGVPFLPAGAVLYAPFAALPPVLADQAWRLLAVAVLTLAVYRAARLIRPDAGSGVAQWVLVLAIPAASVTIFGGQWGLMAFAVLLHATVDVALGRDGRGGLLLALAVALTPQALLAALLFAATHRRVLPSLLPGLAAVFLGPFLHADPAYVARQYAALAGALAAAADGGRGLDAAALLRTLGVAPAAVLMDALRLLALAATLWAAVRACRRLYRPTAALVVLMLAVNGLLLFGPHTEEGAYAGLAVLAALAAFAEAARRPRAALPVLLGALAVALGVRLFGAWLYEPLDGWLQPALALAFYGYLGMLLGTGRSLTDPPPEPMRIDVWLPNRVALVLCLLIPPVIGLYRLAAASSLPGRLASFDATDFLMLVVALNVLVFTVVTVSGPVLAWMRDRRP